MVRLLLHYWLYIELAISLHLYSFIIEGDSLDVTLATQQPALTQD
jgi:hypothetical protein